MIAVRQTAGFVKSGTPYKLEGLYDKASNTILHFYITKEGNNDKKAQLYYLIEEFVKGNYSVKSFCQAYEDIFYPDFPQNELTSEELSKFEFLGSVVSRFSPFDEDVKLYPNVYFTEEYVKESILNIYFELLYPYKCDE